jgi:hypothetical protein
VPGIEHPAARNRRTVVTKTVLCIQISIHGVTLHSLWQHNPVNNTSHLRTEILLILLLHKIGEKYSQDQQYILQLYKYGVSPSRCFVLIID